MHAVTTHVIYVCNKAVSTRPVDFCPDQVDPDILNQKEYQNVSPGHASDGDFLPGKILLKTIDFERPGGRE